MTAIEFLELPMVAWQDAVESMTSTEQHILQKDLSAIAMKSARAYTYVHDIWFGDSHDDAVKDQNKAADKCAKALGYSGSMAIHF